MPNYIALLRGINVGGKNKISMPLLKSAFEELGFQNPHTYINSGNVLFSSELLHKAEIITLCKSIIMQKFALDIPVCIITSDELTEALSNAPDWWDACSDDAMVHQAIFLIPPVTVDEVYSAVGEAKSNFEKVGHYNNVIFWSAAKATFNKTRWCKISSTAVYNKVTIRNANTSKKLLALCSK